MRIWSWLMMLGVAVSSCPGGDERQAFSEAKAAVDKRIGAEHPEFQNLELRRLTGLQGSEAKVVCGELRPVGGGSGLVSTPFIYIWRLDPKVADAGRAAGELMVIEKIDRRSLGELAHFCGWANSTSPNERTYFN